MTAEARRLAFQALQDVALKNRYANLALQSVLANESLDPRDKALCTEIVYGTIQRQRSLDALLQPLMSRSLADLDPAVLTILRMTAYQLAYLDKVPAYAAIHDAVELTKQTARKAAGFVNGVLRSFARDGRPAADRLLELVCGETNLADRIGVQYSYPTWIVEAWLRAFGEAKTIALAKACNAPAGFSVRVNPLKTSRQEVLAALNSEYGDVATPSELSEVGIRFHRGIDTHSWSALERGEVTIQDEGAMLVAPLLHPQPGQRILDMCAGVGTKTTHIAELQGDAGTIVACDIYPHKLRSLRSALERRGMSSISALLADARSLAERSDFLGAFDAVLLDAPCTGLGVLRHRPDIRWKRTPEDVASLASLQRELLGVAVKLVRTGGLIVYCTCTLLNEENQDVVLSVVRESAGAVELEDVSAELPPGVVPAQGAGCLLTPDVYGTDGFFMARLRKVQ
jgi:16S rRNA (cytosine967-C5)-methyltransferase